MNTPYSDKRREISLPVIEVEKNMPDHSNDPYFINKARKAEATLKKYGFPKGVENINGYLVVVSPQESK